MSPSLVAHTCRLCGCECSYDPQLMNSKKIRADVWGASTSTWVAGLCIQEVLTTGEVMFEWRSWDHLPRVYWETNMSVEHNVWDLTHGTCIRPFVSRYTPNSQCVFLVFRQQTPSTSRLRAI